LPDYLYTEDRALTVLGVISPSIKFCMGRGMVQIGVVRGALEPMKLDGFHKKG
jgi:hypothetical protein